MTVAVSRLSTVSSPAQTRQERLDLRTRIANCVSRFRSYQSQSRISNRNQRLFDDLDSICKPALQASFSSAFESNPRVIGSVIKLEDYLDDVMTRGKAGPNLEQEIAAIVTSILSRYKASLPKAPVDSRVGSGVSLQRFGIDKDIEKEVCGALDSLAELGHGDKIRGFERRLKDLSRDVALGAVSELRVIYRLCRLQAQYEILDVNCQLNQRTLEFFDLVVRDKQTGRLVLIETKKGGSYGLSTFLAQFLGIGRPRINGHATCQIDALRYPKRYSALGTKSYAGDLESGNFEIWVVSEEGFAFEDFDSTLLAIPGITIANVLCYLTHHHTNIRSMQTFTDEDLRKIAEGVRRMINGTSLEETIIKFRTLDKIA